MTRIWPETATSMLSFCFGLIYWRTLKWHPIAWHSAEPKTRGSSTSLQNADKTPGNQARISSSKLAEGTSKSPTQRNDNQDDLAIPTARPRSTLRDRKRGSSSLTTLTPKIRNMNWRRSRLRVQQWHSPMASDNQCCIPSLVKEMFISGTSITSSKNHNFSKSVRWRNKHHNPALGRGTLNDYDGLKLRSPASNNR